jgi:hypothetical protein
MSCDHETSVIQALHSGEWTRELRLHVEECLDCSEALHLAEALRAEARRVETHCNPPDPHWILQRSRQMAREIAIRRLNRLLAAMRALATVYVVAVVGWLLRGDAALQYREVASVMHGASGTLALIGAMAATVCVAAGLFPVLLERSRTVGD